MMFDQVGNEDMIPFYKRDWFIAMTLVFLTPVGLILTWTVTDWDYKTKFKVTLIVPALVASCLFLILWLI
jgi:hypothetical protein